MTHLGTAKNRVSFPIETYPVAQEAKRQSCEEQQALQPGLEMQAKPLPLHKQGMSVSHPLQVLRAGLRSLLHKSQRSKH